MLAGRQAGASRDHPLAPDAGKCIDLAHGAIEGRRVGGPGRADTTLGSAPAGGVAAPARAQGGQRPSSLRIGDLHHCPYSDPFPANLSDLSTPRAIFGTEGSVSRL
jgi:hypothetical protein